VDMSLLQDETIRQEIERYNEIGSNEGLRTKAAEGEGDDMNVPAAKAKGEEEESSADEKKKNAEEDKEQSFEKKFQSFYANLLYFAFLTNDKEMKTLSDIIEADGEDNDRIFKNLGLSRDFLVKFRNQVAPQVLQSLEFKIANIHQLANDTTLPPLDRALNAMKKFGRMSISEIVTPEDIADEMVAALPEDAKNGKVLDIASKQGEFAIALWKRFGDGFRNNIYAIPTSPLAYEFTRKIFSIIGIPVANVFSDFTSYDLINPNKKDKLIQELKDMKFNTIIGNPPYQKENDGNGSGKDPIYHYFIDLSIDSSKLGTLVHPARFLFNAGKTPKPWNKKMLNNDHYKVIRYWEKVEDSPFGKSVDIKGGVAITFWNNDEQFGKIGTFTKHSELNTILKHVLPRCSTMFSDIVYSRDLYRFNEKLYIENPSLENRQSEGHRYDVGTTVFDIFPEIFSEQRPDSGKYARIIGRLDNKRVGKWTKAEYMNLPDNFENYKVIIATVNGTGALGEELSSPFIGEPYDAHTVTFLSIGKFNTQFEAEACLKYIKTKFARTMLGILKVTQHNTKYVWEYVPLQDFTPSSDIDWSKSVADIDLQLYAKYGLTQEERDFIEHIVKPME